MSTGAEKSDDLNELHSIHFFQNVISVVIVKLRFKIDSLPILEMDKTREETALHYTFMKRNYVPFLLHHIAM